MADPLSITASIIAVLQLTKSVVDYVKDVKGGSDDRIRLRESIWSTISLLEMLKGRFEDASDNDDLSSAAVKMDVEVPLREMRHILERLVAKLAPASKFDKAMKKATWPFEKAEVKDMLSSIEAQKSHLALAMQNNHMALTQSIKQDVQGVSASLEGLKLDHSRHIAQFRTNKEREAICWISSLDFAAKQSAIEAVRVPWTSEWILQDITFKSWLDGTMRILWCPGIPGAGKTVIASVVINHLLDLQKVRPDVQIGVSFIYCNYKEQINQTILELMSSLLRQLAAGASELSPTLLNGFKKKYDDKMRHSLPEVLEALEVIVATYQTVYVVIDALDECTDSDGTRSEIVELLRELPLNLKILCTSRDTIGSLFLDAGKIQIYAKETDVEQYLKGRIEKSVRLRSHVRADPTLLQSILDSIMKRVDGMFLLAQLHVEILSKKADRKSVRRALEVLPTTIKATYDEAIDRIRRQDVDDKDLAEKALYWISNATRPLKLIELRCAIAVENMESDEDCLDEESFVEKDILIDVCAGLVTTDSDREESIVRLVHYTTQEYFEKNNATIFPNAQARIARACLRYLSLKAFLRPSVSNWEFDRRLSLYRYATRNWGLHVVHAPEEEISEELEYFFHSGPHINSCLEGIIGYAHNTSSLKPLDSSLWMASFFGLTHTVKTLLHEGADFNVEIRHRYVHRNESQSALQNSVMFGHEDILTLFLDSGITIPNAEESQVTLPALAALEGHLDIIRVLHARGFNICAQDPVFGNTLLAGVRGQSEAVCQYLISYNTDISMWESPEDFKDTPLQLALNSAQVRHTGFSLRPRPFHTSAPEEGLSIARMICKAGADLEAMDSNGETPLQLAARLKNYDMVRILLESGLSMEYKDCLGRTLLHFIHYDENMIRYCIISGADVNSRATSGETPLHYAASFGDIVSARLLIEHGAKLEIETSEGHTPLRKAIMYGHHDVATYLTSHQNKTFKSRSTSPQESSRADGKATISVELQRHLSPGFYVVNFSFSNDGKYLATYGVDSDQGGRGGVVEIYDMESFALVRSLGSCGRVVKGVVWSPDDSNLLIITTGAERDRQSIQMWDNVKWERVIKFSHSFFQGVHCHWVFNKSQLVTYSSEGGRDSYGVRDLLLWSVEGTLIHDFACPEVVYGCAISSKTGNLVAFTINRIFVYSLETLSLLVTEDLKRLDYLGGNSLDVATDSSNQYAVLGMRSGQVVLRLDTLEILAFFDFTQDFIGDSFMYPSLGGCQNKYIARGNKDGHVYIWDCETGELAGKQLATGARSPAEIAADSDSDSDDTAMHWCMDVAWNHTIPDMLATLSDTGIVTIWKVTLLPAAQVKA
ncbi:hypothetical protein VTL71DRAFT_15695 [Oculimacula yallundae]|uniref:NACHT domain-containing protein n=1 Tax=Oculimacula yallundae TaxID=86028 RepID=A0ABR4CI21_9HELO